MDRKKFTNEELDIAGREVIKASIISCEEIDRIVSSPVLFNKIRRQIETDRPLQTATFFERWGGAQILSWYRPLGVAAAALLFIAVTVTAFIVVKNGAGPKEPVAVINGSSARPVQPPGIKDNDTPQIAIDEPTAPLPAAYKKEPVRAQKAVVKRQVKSTHAPTFEAEGDFYPVTFGGSAEEMSLGGQILRTEIPRSSLMAMGMDMPIESANEKVKTDLLVGPDGVVRGVRIVK